MGVTRSWLRAPDVSYRANEYVAGSPGNVGGRREYLSEARVWCH